MKQKEQLVIDEILEWVGLEPIQSTQPRGQVHAEVNPEKRDWP